MTSVQVSVRCVALALAFAATGVQAQQKYPVKPIRLMTTFAPGGGSDILARILAPQVSEALGQSVIVDNRAGGGGTLVGTTGLLATVHPSVPFKTLKELIAHARAHPGKLNFGSAGVGGLGHLAQELFQLQTRIKVTHIPYKGSGPVMNALLSGEVDSSFSSMVPSIPHVKAGRLRPIAVTIPKRSPALPDVPTFGETVPGYDVTHWYGIWGPKGIPNDIVLRWNREVAKVLNTPAMKKWMAQEGLEPAGGPPEEFQQRIKSDVEKWKKVVKEAGIVIAK